MPRPRRGGSERKRALEGGSQFPLQVDFSSIIIGSVKEEIVRQFLTYVFVYSQGAAERISTCMMDKVSMKL